MKSHRITPPIPHGFSLIELLVVVSLLALLLGLLLPALAKARSASRRAACASNIRQIAFANLSYSGDHNGRLAPGASNFLANLDRWHGQRDSVHERFVPERGPLSRFLGPEGVVRNCPSFTPDRSQPGSDFESGAGGYGYNNAYLGVDERRRDTQGVRSSSINLASQTVMFSDSAFAQAFPHTRIIEYSFVEPPVQRDHENTRLDPSSHFRHQGRANVAWADAHVSPEALAHTGSNVYGVDESTMHELAIGWFGPEGNRLFDLE